MLTDFTRGHFFYKGIRKVMIFQNTFKFQNFCEKMLRIFQNMSFFILRLLLSQWYMAIKKHVRMQSGIA